MPWHKAIYATRSWLFVLTFSIAVQAALFGAGFHWLASVDRSHREQIAALHDQVVVLQGKVEWLNAGIDQADAHLQRIIGRLNEVDLRMIKKLPPQ